MRRIVGIIVVLAVVLNQYVVGKGAGYGDTLKNRSKIGIISQIEGYRDMNADLYNDYSLRSYIKEEFFKYLEEEGIKKELIDRYKIEIERAERDGEDLYRLYLDIDSNIRAIKEFSDIGIDLDSYILFGKTGTEEDLGWEAPISDIGEEEEPYQIIVEQDLDGNFVIYNKFLNRKIGVIKREEAEYILDICIKDNLMYVAYSAGSIPFRGESNIRVFDLVESSISQEKLLKRRDGKSIIINSMRKQGPFIFIDYVSRNHNLKTQDCLSVFDTEFNMRIYTFAQKNYEDIIFDTMSVDHENEYYYIIREDRFYNTTKVFRSERNSKNYGGRYIFSGISREHLHLKTQGDYAYVFYRNSEQSWDQLEIFKGKEKLDTISFKNKQFVYRKGIILGEYLYVLCDYEGSFNVLVIKNGKYIGKIFTGTEDVVPGEQDEIIHEGVLYIPLSQRDEERSCGFKIIKDGEVLKDLFFDYGDDIAYIGYTAGGDGIVCISYTKESSGCYKYYIISYIRGEMRLLGCFFSEQDIEVTGFYQHGRKMYLSYDEYEDGKNVKVVDIFDDEATDLFEENKQGDLKVIQLIDNIFFVVKERLRLYSIKKADISGNVEDAEYCPTIVEGEDIRIGAGRDGLIFYKDSYGRGEEMVSYTGKGEIVKESPLLRYVSNGRRIVQDNEIKEIDVEFIRQHKGLLKENIDKQVFQHDRERYVRNIIRLKSCAPKVLEISKKTQATALVHNICMHLETKELEVLGSRLGKIDEGVLGFLIQSFSGDTLDAEAFKGLKEKIFIENEEERRKAIKEFIVEDIYTNKILASTHIDPCGMIPMHTAIVSIGSYLLRNTSVNRNQWRTGYEQLSVDEGWRGYIHKMSEETKIKIEAKSIFKDDDLRDSRMIKLWRFNHKYEETGAIKNIKEIKDLETWNRLWALIDSLRIKFREDLRRHISIMDVIEVFSKHLKEIIFEKLILENERPPWYKKIGFGVASLFGYNPGKDTDNITPEDGESMEEKKRYRKEINILGIKILIRYIEYRKKGRTIYFIMPPGLEELGYENWYETYALIGSMNISANDVMRELSIFVKELRTSYDDRIRTYKTLLDAA